MSYLSLLGSLSYLSLLGSLGSLGLFNPLIFLSASFAVSSDYKERARGKRISLTEYTELTELGPKHGNCFLCVLCGLKRL